MYVVTASMPWSARKLRPLTRVMFLLLISLSASNCLADFSPSRMVVSKPVNVSGQVLYGSIPPVTLRFPKPVASKDPVNQTYDWLDVEGCNSRISIGGHPALPIKTVVFKLDLGVNLSTVNTQVVNTSLTERYIICPALIPAVIGNKGGITTPNSSIYGSDKLYPGKWSEYVTRIGIDPDSDQRIQYVIVILYPVQYAPLSRAVTVCQEATIRVQYEGVPKAYAAATYNLLIVTSPALQSQALELAAYRTSIGISTKTLTTDEIYANYPGVDNQEKIRNAVKAAVNSWGIQYLLILGDHSQVPTRLAFIPDGDASDGDLVETDLYYVDLQYTWDENHDGKWGELRLIGGDSVDGMPDLYVGRLPASTTAEASNLVNKIKQYELNANPSSSWFKSILLLGPLSESETLKDYIRNNYVPGGFSATKLYTSTGTLTLSNVMTQVNNGYGFVNFAGHGNPSSWSLDGPSPPSDLIYWYTHASGQTNGFKLPMIAAMACSTSRFSDYDCIGERFLLNPSGGAIAYFGATRIAWTNPIVTYGLAGEMDWRLFQAYYDGYRRIGQIWLRAVSQYVSAHGIHTPFLLKPLIGYYADWKTVAEYSCPFGDPSLMIGGPGTYSVTFYTDPSSVGSISANDVVKSNGATGTYVVNQRVHTAANLPSGYSFSYWEASGVTVDNQLSRDTYMTVLNNGWLKAHFSIPTRTIRVYSLPIYYLGQDPESAASNNIGASVKVDYVYQGQSQARTSNTIFDVTADIGSTITFSVASTPSGWTFKSKWDHYRDRQYDGVSLTIQVPSGSEIDKVAAFFARVYQVTFASSGIGADTGTAIIVTVNGVGYQQSQLPYTAWYDSGTSISYAFASTVSAGLGRQYVWTSTSGLSQIGRTGSFTVSAVGTVTANYKTQYYLTVNSAYGSPTGTRWYDSGSSALFSVTSPVSGGAGIRYVCVGYSGDASGSGTSGSITMNGPKAVTFNWKTQYLLTVNNGGHGTASVGGYYDSGNTASFSISPTTVPGVGGTQYVFMQWSGDSTSMNPSDSILMNGPKTVTVNWRTQYQVTLGYTGLDNTAVGTVVTVDGSAKTYGDLPFSKWVDSSSSVSYSYATTVSSSATSKQFRFDSATGPSSPMTVTGPTIVTGNYKTQWKVFFDASANVKSDTSPAPIVKVDGVNKTAGDLPFSKWVDDGSSVSYNYYSPVSSSVAGKRYRWNSTNGLGQTLQSNTFTVTGTGSVTASYKTQYQLTIQANPVGAPVSGTGTYWYDEGISVSITATVSGSGWVFWSWTGVGDGSYTGTSNPANIVMNGPISETITFAALITVTTTTTTSLTSTSYTSTSVSTYQRSNTTTTATIPSTSYQTMTTTRYSGATSTTYTTRTILYSTLTSLSTTTTTSTKMSTVVSTESTGTTATTTTRTSMTTESTTEPFDRLQYQGAATVTQTFTSTFTSGGTIYLKVVIQYTSIEQYLQRIISTITSWINELTRTLQSIFVTATVKDTVTRVEPAPKLGETIGTLFSSNSSLGFMTTGNIFDDSSIGFMYGHRNPPKVLFPKTDVVRVNQTTKAPTWSDYTHLVMVGGRAANPTLAYYEDSGKAPLKFSTNSTHYLIMKDSTVAYAIVPSSITSTNDYFVMEVIPDGSRRVISLWGMGAPGTYVAGVYFDMQYTNLASLTAGWYVVRWQGAGAPLPSDTFTVVASGS